MPRISREYSHRRVRCLRFLVVLRIRGWRRARHYQRTTCYNQPEVFCLSRRFPSGVAGEKWITNEVDKKLLKESVKIAGTKKLTDEECEKLVEGPALQVLTRVEKA